jgi:hypothetical protein
MIPALRGLWLLALPLEAAGGWLFITLAAPGNLLGLVLHLVASGVFGLSLLTRQGGRWNWAWPLLGGTLALLAFPLLGMLAIAVAFALSQLPLARPDLRGVEQVHAAAALEARPADAVARAQAMEVALLDELEIEPVVDVLRENDPELKRAAIEAITRQGGPSAVRLLIGLLHDPSPEARFFASIGLSRLEDEISRAILAAQRAVAEHPTPAAQEQLGQLYLDYAVSGFLEGVTREYYLDLARRAFETALPASAVSDRLQQRLAQVHLLLGNIAEAAALLDELAERHPTEAAVHLLRMEAIYQFGDVRELAVYARRALPALSGVAEGSELLEWWATAGPQEVRVG